MRDIDKLIRTWVRAWLHLPKDFPSAMIHSDIIAGGLGINIAELQDGDTIRLE